MDRQSYQRGLEAYERGDYDAALREWRPLAEQGVAEAQYRIGDMYSIGEGVHVDDTEAEKWIRKAAEQGLAKAQHMLVLRFQRLLPTVDLFDDGFGGCGPNKGLWVGVVVFEIIAPGARQGFQGGVAAGVEEGGLPGRTRDRVDTTAQAGSWIF